MVPGLESAAGDPAFAPVGGKEEAQLSKEVQKERVSG